MNALAGLEAVSWGAEVRTGSDPKLYGNSVRFPTYEEALAAAVDLSSRWLLVVEFRAVASEDPPNYRWDHEANRAVAIEKRE